MRSHVAVRQRGRTFRAGRGFGLWNHLSLPMSASPRCSYVLPNKKRQCRMPAKQGFKFCGAHLTNTQPCPHCGTTLPPASLPRHLRPTEPLCPVLKRQAQTALQPWYRPGCNGVFPSSVSAADIADPVEIAQLVDSILQRQLSTETPHWIPNGAAWGVVPEADQIRANWGDARDSGVKLEPKHFAQIEVLSAALLHQPPEQCTVLELGAGRAYTSMYVAHALKLRNVPTDVVAVDRAAIRMKADRALRFWEQGDNSIRSFQRLRCDVTDLYLPGVDIVNDSVDLRVIGKHVCGAALDVSLQAVDSFVKETGRRAQTVRMVFASCCRRLCAWEALGKCQQVWKEWGVGAKCFGQISKMASWGLDERHAEEQAEIGRKCRLLIDLSRVLFLRDAGWEAHVGIYTNASPENACIVALWRNKQIQSD